MRIRLSTRSNIIIITVIGRLYSVVTFGIYFNIKSSCMFRCHFLINRIGEVYFEKNECIMA